MARVKFDELEHYGGQGGAGFFSLKSDGEVARVRFMLNGIEDLESYAVHKVTIDGRDRWVSCLREYNDPMHKCPFCEARMSQQVRLYIPIYNVDEDKVQLWERGKKFAAKFGSLCARYPNLVSHEFEIERHGAKGDTSTTYEIYEVGSDNTTLEDLPELPSVLGGVVLDKTADDMRVYIDDGFFPSNEVEEQPRRRTEESQVQRRTPVTGRRNRETF